MPPITIGSIPLQVNLYKVDDIHTPVDSFEARFTYSHVERLRAAFNVLETSGSTPVWEVFYRLK